jgi:hypothetical protein
MAEQIQQPGAYKSQPWVLFDTIAAASFLLGDSANPAAGGGPAITQNGVINFFQSANRTKATMPWYTNLDQNAMMSFGLEVWQIYLRFGFPAMPPVQTLTEYDTEASLPAGPPPTIKLMEAILNYGVLELNLGQEEQTVWPLAQFGAGGGLAANAAAGVVIGQNSNPDSYNVMKLPEPIQMMRTQNISAIIRLAPEVFEIIGTPGAGIGVGGPLADYQLATELSGAEPPVATIVNRQQPPYTLQLGLVGRRVKDTQYGQVPNASGI